MQRDALKLWLIILTGCLTVLVSCAPPGIYHTVRPGQTLYSIARTYNIEEARLARINHVTDPTQLKVNQKLYIPGATQLRNVPVTMSSSSKPPDRAPASDTAAARPRPPQPSSTTKTAKTPGDNSRPATTSGPVKGFFIWPVKGKLLNKFGAQGQKVYKGIEIAVPSGTPVEAAASGKVIYSGNAIPGYGNLVILEHSDSFFSVYGYNQKNLVKMNDHVGQGEKIALSGAPPSGQSARLHFEIRKGKSAVDPILYLP
jgi:murein DD-endopeptidase MepM/ murein hydrolase activator NlpD